jgi:hypothetical protein
MAVDLSGFLKANQYRRVKMAMTGAGLAVCLIFSSFGVACSQEKTSGVSKLSPYFPSLLICDKTDNMLIHSTHGKIDWRYELDGPILDVQRQPQEDKYLVTGGSQKVFLLRRLRKGYDILWSWEKLQDVSVVCAVAAEWGMDGNPSLILAGDARNQRLFLAEARSHGVKIRWQYKLPAPPNALHLCPDSGNFLVALKNATVKEIFFQEDRVVWELGKEQGLKNPSDAVRDPWHKTYVADAAEGDVLCFNSSRETVWKTHLPFAPGTFETISLALYKKKGKRLVMASVHFKGSEGKAQNVVYLLSMETGKVVAWSDKLERGGYPDFIKAVPDLAVYQKKQ